jgi:hypothetical protein
LASHATASNDQGLHLGSVSQTARHLLRRDPPKIRPDSNLGRVRGGSRGDVCDPLHVQKAQQLGKL